jgi:hypothetical protein
LIADLIHSEDNLNLIRGILTKGLLKITTLVIDKMAVTPAAGWLDTNG